MYLRRKAYSSREKTVSAPRFTSCPPRAATLSTARGSRHASRATPEFSGDYETSHVGDACLEIRDHIKYKLVKPLDASPSAREQDGRWHYQQSLRAHPVSGQRSLAPPVVIVRSSNRNIAYERFVNLEAPGVARWLPMALDHKLCLPDTTFVDYQGA